MNEIEEYYCGPEVNRLSERRWFDRPAAEDIPSCIFTQEKYRPLRQYALFRMGFFVVTLRNCRILREIIGDGKVLVITEDKRDYMVTVDFEDFGIKKMLAGFAKLEKI